MQGSGRVDRNHYRRARGRMSDVTFEGWLLRLRECTRAFQQKKGAWSLSEQIAHTHSEVSEVYQAVRHDEGRARILEEICDSVLASFTMADVAGFSQFELSAMMERTLQKVERRAGLRQP